jgi:hypothetical protein
VEGHHHNITKALIDVDHGVVEVTNSAEADENAESRI